jgi:hypothetical protein
MMIEKEIEMSVVYKSKSQIRQETADAVALFLKRGGSIEVVKSRKAPKQTMKCKNTRVASTGTAGFAVGFPRKSFI